MTLSIDRRVRLAARIFADLDLCFAHREAVPHLDLDEAFGAYLAEGLAAEDRLAFDRATLRFMASFRNGHTDFDDAWLWERFGGSLGFHARPLGDDWIVTQSRRDDLLPGVAITAIDGRPMAEVFSHAKAYIGASSDRAAARLLFSRPYLLPERFALALEDGRTVAIAKGSARKTAHTASLDPVLSRPRRGGAFLLAVPSFAEPRFEARAVDLVGTLAPGSALVVDLRGNGGGDTPTALLGRLMDRPWRMWREATPMVTGLGRARGLPDETLVSEPDMHEPEAGAFAGRLALLIDGGTFSAAEDFAAPFKDNGRALLVGETSAGSSGQPLHRRFDDGMSFRVGARRQFFPDGAPFEGVGIAPDLPVAQTRDDLARRRDSQLAAALEAVWPDRGPSH